MFEGLKKWWAERPRWTSESGVCSSREKPKPKLRISVLNEFAVGSEVHFKINDWTVTYTFQRNFTISYDTNGELLRILLDPKYKDCWSGDVFAVKVLLKSGEINERNYP